MIGGMMGFFVIIIERELIVVVLNRLNSRKIVEVIIKYISRLRIAMLGE